MPATARSVRPTCPEVRSGLKNELKNEKSAVPEISGNCPEISGNNTCQIIVLQNLKFLQISTNVGMFYTNCETRRNSHHSQAERSQVVMKFCENNSTSMFHSPKLRANVLLTF